MVNLSAFIAYHARVTPDRLAVVYGDQRVSYGALADRIGQVAALLLKEGIGAGDVVAVFMKNSVAFLEIAFAVSHVGGVFLPINFRLAAEEARHIMENASAKLLFADAEFTAVTASLGHVIVLDAQAQHDSRHLVPQRLTAPSAAPRKPEDLFRLMYTSGTTDRPKGVMHSYDNFYWKMHGPCDGSWPDRGGSAVDVRAALSCRRLRPAGRCGAVAGRPSLHPTGFRSSGCLGID